MKSFKVSTYLRNGKKQAAGDFDIEASNWPAAARRAAKEALWRAKESGISRPKMIELRISAVKQRTD